jgi:hypothetical protein
VAELSDLWAACESALTTVARQLTQVPNTSKNSARGVGDKAMFVPVMSSEAIKGSVVGELKFT